MKNKEKKARKILQTALDSILELGYHLRATHPGVIRRVEQAEFRPIPEELKRRLRMKKSEE